MKKKSAALFDQTPKDLGILENCHKKKFSCKMEFHDYTHIQPRMNTEHDHNCRLKLGVSNTNLVFRNILNLAQLHQIGVPSIWE